jgi:hypothetical protein
MAWICNLSCLRSFFSALKKFSNSSCFSLHIYFSRPCLAAYTMYIRSTRDSNENTLAETVEPQTPISSIAQERTDLFPAPSTDKRWVGLMRPYIAIIPRSRGCLRFSQTSHFEPRPAAVIQTCSRGRSPKTGGYDGTALGWKIARLSEYVLCGTSENDPARLPERYHAYFS